MTSTPPLPIEELPQRLPPEARLLGLDVGTKTIGLALSDVTRSVATPYETLRRTKFTADAKELLRIVAERQVGGLVIGLPLSLLLPTLGLTIATIGLLLVALDRLLLA